jgi:outer membrane protein assembly factor BamE
MKRLIIILVLGMSVVGCLHPYVPSIQQGSVPNADQIAQLKEGMSKEDVQYYLGLPVLEDEIDSDRWDYIYTFKKVGQPLEEKRLTLYFQNNQLIKMTGNEKFPVKAGQN